MRASRDARNVPLPSCALSHTRGHLGVSHVLLEGSLRTPAAKSEEKRMFSQTSSIDQEKRDTARSLVSP